MRELDVNEIEMVSGGHISLNEGAGLILALGAAGGIATFFFAAPIAIGLFYLSRD